MEFTLPSGSKMVVSEASYVDANALLKALLKTAKGVQLAKNPLETDVTMLKEIVLEAATSDDVDRMIFKCAERAVYENVKVTRELFDDPKLKEKARGDYFLILWHVIEVNCGPFFGKTFSALKERLATSPFFQKSSVPSTTPS